MEWHEEDETVKLLKHRMKGIVLSPVATTEEVFEKGISHEGGIMIDNNEL